MRSVGQAESSDISDWCENCYGCLKTVWLVVFTNLYNNAHKEVHDQRDSLMCTKAMLILYYLHQLSTNGHLMDMSA